MVSARLEVDDAVWLSESDLLMLGRVPAAAAGGLRALAESSYLLLPPHRGTTRAADQRLLVYSAGGATTPLGLPLMLEPADVAGRLSSVRDFAREGLAWLDPRTRGEVLAFVVRSTARRIPNVRAKPRLTRTIALDRESRLGATLHALREALRERLPVSVTPGGPIALIDAVARVDRDAYFIRGRIRYGASRLSRLTAVSPEGARVELLERAYWYELPAPADQAGGRAWKGFTAFFGCAPSFRSEGWLVEMETRAGELLEVAAPSAAIQAIDVIRIILEDLAVEQLPETKLRTSQLLPAVRRLQKARKRDAVVETVKQFGTPPVAPDVSLIVPLYRRVDLVEHQMAQFAGDPDLQAADLIYVLDSPELKDELNHAAGSLFALYRQPFRVVVLSANVGFAGANNLGARLARGRLLVLLNSDVFPESRGWLSALIRFYDSLPNPGAVGPKLLYEDDTIQHAGMFFERLSDTQPWSNQHYFKGMHRDLPAAAKSRPVPAVTGACLMVARDLYAQIGGLSGDYVQGDFEDSEFCLRLLEAGRQNWYCADTALYHLEASSYDPERRRVVDGFNRWLHTHLWAKTLSALGGPDSPRIAPARPHVRSGVEVDDEVAVGARSRS